MVALPDVGITPAHAGKRIPAFAKGSRTKDHPRTRGEKSLIVLYSRQLKGSPPHTRGKGCQKSSERKHLRITPAHAGKRRCTRHIPVSLSDHPRTRGEKVKDDHPQDLGDGSPPHTRGKASEEEMALTNKRITPAHAGKSSGRSGVGRWRKDHPRTRGEKIGLPCVMSLLTGSPPHTRGKDAHSRERSLQAGITPAHAGKSNHKNVD